MASLIRRAKIIEEKDLAAIFDWIDAKSSHKIRDKVAVMLTVKAGLRAAEVASIRWRNILKADGTVADNMELTHDVTKGGKFRVVPVNATLKALLSDFYQGNSLDDFVVNFRSNTKNRRHAIVVWFADLYKKVGLKGCTSHSGRRSFITHAARKAGKFGVTIRDIQLIVGHARLDTTERYIEPLDRVGDLINAI